MELTRITRRYVEVDVSATLAEGGAADLDAVQFAVLSPRARPTGATTWTTASLSAGSAKVLVAGPDADPAGALSVPSGGGDLWLRAVDSAEVDAVRVTRLTVL